MRTFASRPRAHKQGKHNGYMPPEETYSGQRAL